MQPVSKEEESAAEPKFTLDGYPGAELIKQGAESRIFRITYLDEPTIVKERFKKTYRHPQLDAKLTKQRTTAEVRCMAKCQKLGVETPVIANVDAPTGRIFMDYIDGDTVKDTIRKANLSKAEDKDRLLGICRKIGVDIAKMHDAGVIHGDLTTSNMMLRKGSEALVWIDFGLSSSGSQQAEDKAVDLYVLERAFVSTHPNSEQLVAEVLQQYQSHSKQGAVTMKRLEQVRARGRKRSMIG